MPLPSLAGLSLGPPTGPMAQFGVEVLEPPSDGKRQKSDSGLTVNVVRWDASQEREKSCILSHHEFVPGEWVYKTPDGHPYDPWFLHRMWLKQEEEAPNRPWFWNLYTNKNDIPRYEYELLAEWVSQPGNDESTRPESPPTSPLDLAKLVHKPPVVNGKEFEQPPQDDAPNEVSLDGDTWSNLSQDQFQDLVLLLSSQVNIGEFRMGNILAHWMSTLRSYYNARLPRGAFDHLRWTAGFKDGEFDINWTIIQPKPPAGAERAATRLQDNGYRVESNMIDILFQPWRLPRDDPEYMRKVLINALRDGLSPRRMLDPAQPALLRQITPSDLSVDFDISMRGVETGAVTFVNIHISPRLLAAFMNGDVTRNGVVYPTTEWLVANHFGVPSGERGHVAYPPDWTTGDGDPRIGPNALRASEQTWNGIVARITSMLYNAMIRTGPHQYSTTDDPFDTRTLFLASAVENVIEQGHESTRLPTHPEVALAGFLSNVDAADTDVYTRARILERDGMVDHVGRKKVSVPFWFAVDTARMLFPR